MQTEPNIMPMSEEPAPVSSSEIASSNNHNRHNGSSRVELLSKLIRLNLHLMSNANVSSQALRHGMDKLLGEIDQTWTSFNHLETQIQTQNQSSSSSSSDVAQTQLKRKQELERDLLLLMKKVRKLKSIFPFSLVIKPEPPNSHLNWRDRSTPYSISAPDKLMQNLKLTEGDIPTFNQLNKSVRGLKSRSRICLIFFLAFPENTIIKKSLLVCWAKANEIRYLNEPVDDLIENRLIHAVYKDTLSVGGYLMHPFVRSTLIDENWLRASDLKQWLYIANSSTGEEEDIIYDDTPLQFSAKSELRMLHLGNWQRWSARHVEVEAPDLFFKEMANGMSRLRYVSLRGISLITELPEFVTDLEDLEILDLKSCHNLEVIPPSIGKLWCSLTHLDMSECYFLEHMPVALSKLCNLRVLKGFVVGETTTEGRSCTLGDLRNLVFLRKLNIYTAVQSFPSIDELKILSKFEFLHSLTISWGGCSVIGTSGNSTVTSATKHNADDFFLQLEISFNLEKLDLQCVPQTFTPNWLVPQTFKHLKNLYLRGGNFSGLDLREHGWNVEILRLKHLSNLEMDYIKLVELFPKLICSEIVECPKLENFPGRNGVWKKDATTRPPPTAYH